MMHAAASGAGPSVVHVLPDKTGGVLSVVASLLAEASAGSLPQHVVLTHDRGDPDLRSKPVLELPGARVVEYSPLENRMAVLARLALAIPRGPGVLVAHDGLELAMLTQHDPGRTVVFLAHGDYAWYYDLAERYQDVIDVFVASSARIAETLRTRLPHRADRVLHLPHGVRLPRRTRTPAPGPLRLLFVGRLDVAKGILDLPAIDARLAALGVDARWTIVGDGPHAARLTQAWPSSARVRFTGALTPDAVAEQCTRHDAYVLPSRAEGFPVALLEAMGSALVPVVSDLPSGVPEMVQHGTTGFRLPVGDADAFARAIATLDGDRALLERMSAAALAHVRARFDLRDRAADYHAVFARWRELRRQRPSRLPLPDASRLDQRWIPNSIVYPLRRGLRWLRS